MSTLFKPKKTSSLSSLFDTSAGPVSRPSRPERGNKEDSGEDTPNEDDEEISELSDNDFDSEEEDVSKILDALDKKKTLKSSKKRKLEEDDLEDKYFSKLLGKGSGEGDEKEGDGKEVENESEGDHDAKDLKIEEILKKNENEIEKADRTVFVGNVPKETAIDKKVERKFRALFSEYGTIESIRFRSVAFAEMIPRKAAFINKKLHENLSVINSYVVFKDKKSASKALSANARVFSGHHLRVDSVSHPAAQDQKRSVFVGNLDFEVAEEPLWKHFEQCGEVEYVRLVRDSKTNLGKGFGYVQFKDSMAVGKALLLDGKKFEGEAKSRPLRISRAKKQTPRPSSSSSNGPKLSNQEKTKLGRARATLGKAGRSQIDSALEGVRAKPGDIVPGINKHKKARTSGRSKERSKVRKTKKPRSAK